MQTPGKAGSAGPEIFLAVNPASPAKPLHLQLETALKTAIRDGTLARGSRLPPTRVLAGQLGCSRWVVVQAYEQLTAEGYLTGRTGSGTSVALAATTAASPPRMPPPPMIRLDFSPGAADLAAFPRGAWTRATAQVMSTATPADLYYAEPTGTAQLRATLAEHLGRLRGLRTSPGQISICAGTTHGLALLARALADGGHTAVGIEDPGWQRLRPPLTAAGLALVPLPVDGDGLQVSVLDRHPHLRAVHVSPAHQFPTGAVLSPARRAALLAWARDRDGLIIEDDYDAEYRYDRRPVGALQALDPGRVAYLGSTSKTLSPALRLGWLITPANWHTAITNLRPGTDLGVSVLDQLAFANLITSGALQRHLRRTRARYRDRRAALAAAIARHLPGAKLEGIAAGLHLLARLPRHLDERQILHTARRQGIRLYSLTDYEIEHRSPTPGLVLGYAGLTTEAINDGIAELAALINLAADGDREATRPQRIGLR
jgi:GntR family transcriptional regulator / MocR family aminotransferase